MFSKTKVYIGKPCKRGHTLRYVKGKGCVECITNWTRLRYKNNPKADNLKSSKWSKANPIKNSAKAIKWVKLHPEKKRVQRRKYRQRHIGKHYRKKKAILQAAPKWLSKHQWQEIENIYVRAKGWTQMVGILYEVDHIVPINGKEVCGLHVPWNLQILTGDENRKKSNLLLD